MLRPARAASKKYGSIPQLYHDSTNSMYYRFQSLMEGVYMDVYLKSMSDLPPDEESRTCPITMDAFDATETGDSNFLPAHPLVCVGELPCKHRFGIFSIMNHFAMCNLRCPICRSGECQRLDVSCLPRHLQATLENRVVTAERSEAALQSEQDRQDVLQMVGGMQAFYATLVIIPAIKMTMYYFEDVGSTRHIGTLELDLIPSGSMEYYIPALHLDLIKTALMSSRAMSVRMTVHSRNVTNALIRLSDTDVMNIDRLFEIGSDTNTISMTNVAQTVDRLVLKRQGTTGLNLTSIQWISGSNVVQRIVA
jgi:hypothetical protein